MPEVKIRGERERGINEKRTVSKLIEMNLPTGIRRRHTYTNITISTCLFFILCWKCVPLPSFIVIFKNMYDHILATGNDNFTISMLEFRTKLKSSTNSWMLYKYFIS